jgi:hypothetical protein
LKPGVDETKADSQFISLVLIYGSPKSSDKTRFNMAKVPLSKEVGVTTKTSSVATHPGLRYELPWVVRTRTGKVIFPRDDLDAFVKNELDVSRLEEIKDRLWLAGRLRNIRPLHRQQLLGRKILVTEQADLHLLWQDDKIFIKPLPAWLLDRDFFQKHDSAGSMLPAARGFLNSYALLISYEIDFILAQELHLLPSDVDWKGWLDIVQDMLPDFRSDERKISPRYQYGELRLSRINRIYRFDPRFRFQHFLRGYHSSSQTFRSFLNRNFGWLLVVFVYFTILLTALQVGLATNQLRDSAPFHAASYGFTVFSLVTPFATILYGAVVTLVLVIYNVTVTLLHVKSEAPRFGPCPPPKPAECKV